MKKLIFLLLLVYAQAYEEYCDQFFSEDDCLKNECVWEYDLCFPLYQFAEGGSGDDTTTTTTGTTTTRVYELIYGSCQDSFCGSREYCAAPDQCACYDFLDTIEENNVPICAYNSSNEGKGVLLMSLDFDVDFSNANHTEAKGVIYDTLSPQIPNSADFDVLTSEDGSFYVNIKVYYTVNDFNRSDFIDFATTTNYSFSSGNITTYNSIIVNKFPSQFAPPTTTTTTTTTTADTFEDYEPGNFSLTIEDSFCANDPCGGDERTFCDDTHKECKCLLIYKEVNGVCVDNNEHFIHQLIFTIPFSTANEVNTSHVAQNLLEKLTTNVTGTTVQIVSIFNVTQSQPALEQANLTVIYYEAEVIAIERVFLQTAEPENLNAIQQNAAMIMEIEVTPETKIDLNFTAQPLSFQVYESSAVQDTTTTTTTTTTTITTKSSDSNGVVIGAGVGGGVGFLILVGIVIYCMRKKSKGSQFSKFSKEWHFANDWSVV
jgi:hypothetical protein